MKPLELQLKEILGAKEYNRFADTVLFPAIQQLSESGKLGDSDLDKLARLTKTYGAGIFDVAATDVGDATKHNLSDGFSIIAKYRLNDDLEFNLFVKKFSDKNSFQKGVTIQEKLVESLKGADMEGVIPDQVFQNKGKRIVMMPLVKAQTLNAVLSEENKEELLKQTIAEYLKIVDHAEAKKVFVPPKRNFFGELWHDDFKLSSLQNFDKFFAKNFGADAELAESYNTHIGKRLNNYPTDLIHGDLHPGNILVNGRTHLIDWELAANGFTEFDLYKLFTKSRVSGVLEDRLLAYTVMKKEELRAKREKRQPASPATHELLFEASKTRYRLNQITQDLLTAERYSKNAQKDAKHHDKLEKMALTAYNIALRNIEKAESEGILDSKFYIRLESFAMKNKPYHPVDDAEFAQLLMAYNPHTTLSQDNLVSHGTETSMPMNKESKQKNLEIIRKSLHKKDWGKIAKLGTAAALMFGIAGFGGVKYLHSENARAEMERKSMRDITERCYMSDFRMPYNTFIEAQLNDGIIPWAYETQGKKRLRKLNLVKDSEVIKQVCDMHNLDHGLVVRMYRINAVFAGISNKGLQDIGNNFLDPYRVTFTVEGNSEKYDPIFNLEEGAKRLSYMFDKYKVDRSIVKDGYVLDVREKIEKNDPSLEPLIQALTQFYFASKNHFKSFKEEDERYVDDKLRAKELNRGFVPDSVREIVYNILTGGPQVEFSTLEYLDSIIPENFMKE